MVLYRKTCTYHVALVIHVVLDNLAGGILIISFKYHHRTDELFISCVICIGLKETTTKP
jgi:hypothetical protein